MSDSGSGGCAGLLLAAGGGRRMGMPKALLRLSGQLLVDRAIDVLRDGGCDPVVVVLGAGADLVRREAQLSGVRVVENPDWADGMGTSLRVGLAACAETPAAAAVVALVDQPGVSAEVVARLRSAWQAGSADAVIAAYDGAPRNPVLLAAASWPEVSETAAGDVGARRWLRQRQVARPESVLVVECGDAGNAADLDTPADVDALAAVLVDAVGHARRS